MKLEKILNHPRVTVGYSKLNKEAIVPAIAHSGDAGYDLSSVEEHWIKPKERRLIGTGLAFEFAATYYGRIAPRSGLAVKSGIDVMAGVVDSTYRGEIKVLLVNLGEKPFLVEKGQRIAQIIFERCHSAKFIESQLSSSERESGGFGSTGE